MISNKSLDKFIELYEGRYKVALTKEEAMHKANGLLNLCKAVYKPVPNIHIKNGKKIQYRKN